MCLYKEVEIRTLSRDTILVRRDVAIMLDWGLARGYREYYTIRPGQSAALSYNRMYFFAYIYVRLCVQNHM